MSNTIVSKIIGVTSFGLMVAVTACGAESDPPVETKQVPPPVATSSEAPQGCPLCYGQCKPTLGCPIQWTCCGPVDGWMCGNCQ